jgi:vacuolar-type H+-ATPase subunit I/STV1
MVFYKAGHLKHLKHQLKYSDSNPNMFGKSRNTKVDKEMIEFYSNQQKIVVKNLEEQITLLYVENKGLEDEVSKISKEVNSKVSTILDANKELEILYSRKLKEISKKKKERKLILDSLNRKSECEIEELTDILNILEKKLDIADNEYQLKIKTAAKNHRLLEENKTIVETWERARETLIDSVNKDMEKAIIDFVVLGNVNFRKTII